MSQQAVHFSASPGSKALFEMTQLALAESANMIAQQNQADIQFAVTSISVEQQSAGQIFSDEADEMIAIKHPVSGDRPGVIAFILAEKVAYQLLQGVLNAGGLLNELSEMDEEALTEIGNIIVNNCLNHYVQVFHESISTSLPQLIHRDCEQLMLDLYAQTDENSSYVVKLDVLLGHHRLPAYLLWLGHLCQLDTINVSI